MKKIYINDYSIYIPDSFESAGEIGLKSGLPENIVKDKLGINRKPVEKRLSTSEMAEQSLIKLINGGIVNKEKIKFLISAGSDYKDHYIWTMAPKLLSSIGIEGAYGFDLSSQCVGSLVALDMARSKVASMDGGTGLLSVATKQSHIVNYHDPGSSFMFDFSDGSLAIAMSQEMGKYEIMGSSFISDGSFTDIVFSGIGERHPGQPDSSYRFLRVDPGTEWKKRMGMVSEKNFMKVIYESLENSGISSSDISYLAFLHTKRSFFNKVLENLGLHKGNSIYLEDFGHMQGVDPFLSMRLAEESGKISPGDYIVLVSSGTGWTWGAMVLKRTYK
jgi:3-oxoacyl-[acyl-carrier-protein] synthase-3